MTVHIYSSMISSLSMKRTICIIILDFVCVAFIFGEGFSLSAGGGAYIGGFFTRYTLDADGMVEGERIIINATQEMNQFNYGFYAFLDATYGVLGVFYQNGINDYKETADISVLTHGTSQNGQGWESVLGFSLMGKYPFKLNEKFTIFPLLGIEYQISLKQERTQPDGYVYNRTDGIREKDKDGNAYLPEDWNSFWFNLGGGIDYMITDNFFIRGELLYGFRLMTLYEIKNLDLMKSQAGDPDPKLCGLTSGPSLRLSAGYRFYK